MTYPMTFLRFLLLIVFLFTANSLAAQTILTTIPLAPESGNGRGPLAVGVNPTTNRIYVLNGSNNVSVIDGENNQVVDTIKLRILASIEKGIGVNSVTNRIYVANEKGFFIRVIDGETNRVINRIRVEDFLGGVNGIAVNPETNRIYVTNPDSGSVTVIQDEE